MLGPGADVVQIVGPSPLFTEQVVEAARASGLPSVYKIDAFAGLSTYYGGEIPQFVDGLYVRSILARALRHTDWVVYSTADFARSFGPTQAPWSVIPLGIEDPCLGRAAGPSLDPREWAPETPRVLFVGQLRRYKGVSYLLEAMRRLADRGTHLSLTVIGSGPDRPRLERLASQLGLRDKVVFRGSLDDDALHREYLTHDALVLPSLLGESFGIVLLEAALHGLRVIASDLPGVREVARRVGGQVVPPGNVGALAEALEVVRPLEPNERAIVGAIPSAFSWTDAARQYLETYDRLIAGHSSGRSVSRDRARTGLKDSVVPQKGSPPS